MRYYPVPNVAILINKINIKNRRNNQRTEPPKSNCTDKTNCPLIGMCHFERIVYKVGVYGRGPIESNVYRNVKKVYVGSKLGPLKKGITIKEVALTRYIDIELLYLITRGRIKKNMSKDPILKRKIIKKWRSIKWGMNIAIHI